MIKCFSLFAVFLCLVGTGSRVSASPNVVRNASFELDSRFNGGPMRQGAEKFMSQARDASGPIWQALPVEGWWAEGPSSDGVRIISGGAHSGKRCLAISATVAPRSVISSLDRFVPAGPVTLSAWVKTSGAKAHIDLDLTTGWQQEWPRGAQVRKSVDLPEDAGWTRVAVTAESPEKLMALMRLTVEQGEVLLDDVQIEASTKPSEFNLRPEEWLRLEFAGSAGSELPKWVQGDKKLRELRVWNDSRKPLRGVAAVSLKTWDNRKQLVLDRLNASKLASGRSRTIAFSIKDLPADAYLVSLALVDGGRKLVDGGREFAIDELYAGSLSNGMLKSRSAIRFAVAPNTSPARIFGVGNGMLMWVPGQDSGQGWSVEEYKLARDLHLTSSRAVPVDDMVYLHAIARLPFHDAWTYWYGGLQVPKALENPAGGLLDVYNPAGLALFKKHAEETGKRHAANPFLASFEMINERPYFQGMEGGNLFPTRYADADFRNWCRKRHGDLSTLNTRWNTEYRGWDEVEQVVSARFIEEEIARRQREGLDPNGWKGDYYSDLYYIGPKLLERIQANPGRGMDWLRWRLDSSLRLYGTFVDCARKYDKKTLYGINLNEPRHGAMLMPFFRKMGCTQFDVVYTTGMPRSVATPYEYLEMLELLESNLPNKPFWGIEVYVQPDWPENYAAFQNWACIAHGMTNSIVFGWKPFSDVGIPPGNRAWEKPGASPMWFLIDHDGTRLPNFHSFARSAKELESYHRKFDGFSIKRTPTDIALFYSYDNSIASSYETADVSWKSPWERARIPLLGALRLNGIAVDYVGDDNLPDTPGKYKTLIVPASYALGQRAAERIARFARAGGTVLLAGPSGLCDEWLNKYDNFGGPAWSDLNWRARDYSTDYADVSFASSSPTGAIPASGEQVFVPGEPGGESSESHAMRGVSIGEMPGAKAITDAAGKTVGWSRPWGKGKLVAYGVFPDLVPTPQPTANLWGWSQQLIQLGGLKFSGRWVGETGPVGEGGVGTGVPVVEVVVRQKSPKEKFVFCLNQGGPGKGTVEVRVGEGKWRAEDALTGKGFDFAQPAGKSRPQNKEVFRVPMSLGAWEYRVIRLVRI